ncbi:MAG: universal stress protein [Acidobacteriota bacterium]
MKTLMATDGSKDATAALRAAARLLRKSENEITLLCVSPDFHPSGKERRRIREEYRRRIARETQSILSAAQKTLLAEGLSAEVRSEAGSPAEVIVSLSESFEVTVVGAKGRYEGSDIGLGPVASRVVEHAPGIVIVGREPAGENDLRILMAIDGSLASKHAISSMVKYFDIRAAEVTLLHVKETPWIHLGLDREWFDYPSDVFDQVDPEIQLEQEFQLEAEEMIEEARARLLSGSCSVLTAIAEGNPATEILGEAESGDYDLIVLGSTGVIDTKHDVLGSVSARVAWQAPCSVAVVKYEREVE